jgi:hypothetical protein
MTDGLDKGSPHAGGNPGRLRGGGPHHLRTPPEHSRLAGTAQTEKTSPPEERPIPTPFSSSNLFEPKLLQRASYLFLYETGVIVAVGILLNYLGLTLSRHLESILFLDMTGTALAAFLLGPWWGATVALLSNSAVNWLLYPEAGADVVIFLSPWSI